MATTLTGPEELKGAVGRELGVSEWLGVTQGVVDRFAEATGDRQWIHVDPVRASQTPFGGTIAHGLLTLSLGPRFMYEILEVRGFDFAVNYGYGRVRFPAPLPVGRRVRMRGVLASVDDVPGGVQVEVTQTFELEGADRPVCVAQSLFRLFVGG